MNRARCERVRPGAVGCGSKYKYSSTKKIILSQGYAHSRALLANGSFYLQMWASLTVGPCLQKRKPGGVKLASENPDSIAKAFKRLHELLDEKQVKMAKEKCVWFGGLSMTQVPDKLKSEGVRAASQTIKTLRAYIGDSSAVSEQLQGNLKKHSTCFRRLEKVGLNNTSLLLLARYLQ